MAKCPKCGKPYNGYKCQSCIDNWDKEDNNEVYMRTLREQKEEGNQGKDIRRVS